MKTVNILRFDEDATTGDASKSSVELIIYKTDEDYYYVDESSFKETDIVLADKPSKQVPVLSLEREKLDGVYLANEGVANFIEADVVKSEDEFTILNDDGYLKEFDNVVLDSSQVYENQTLY